MRDLTRFECSSIAGGEINTHIVIPAQPLTNEESLVVFGIVSGAVGAMAGATCGLANFWSGKAIIGSIAAGTVIGAFALPFGLHVVASGLLAGYKALGMIE